MGIKAGLSIPFAKFAVWKTRKWAKRPVESQEKTLQYLINKAKNTAFGKAHNFDKIRTYEDFKREVPIRDYEGLKSYVERVKMERKMYYGQANQFI